MSGLWVAAGAAAVAGAFKVKAGRHQRSAAKRRARATTVRHNLAIRQNVSEARQLQGGFVSAIANTGGDVGSSAQQAGQHRIKNQLGSQMNVTNEATGLDAAANRSLRKAAKASSAAGIASAIGEVASAFSKFGGGSKPTTTKPTTGAAGTGFSQNQFQSAFSNESLFSKK